jgi:tetratricopeptide (TPR) repeat protein
MARGYLAGALIKQRRLDEAECLLEELVSQIATDDQETLVLCLGRLARVHFERKEYPRALNFLNRAEQLARSVHGGASLEVAILLGNRGLTHKDMEERRLAQTDFLEAFSIARSVFPPDHPLCLMAGGWLLYLAATTRDADEIRQMIWQLGATAQFILGDRGPQAADTVYTAQPSRGRLWHRASSSAHRLFDGLRARWRSRID